MSMDVFSLRDTVVAEYRKFATSFTRIQAEDIRTQVEAIYEDGRFWPDPLIQINPNFQRGAAIEDLVAAGTLDPRTSEIFRTNGAPLPLYRHQAEAIALASEGESYVVTTGTGSGKSLCFFIPVVSAILQAKRTDPTPRTRAIVIYPMNALANSQLEELEKYVGNVQGTPPVTFGIYTGQENDGKRKAIADNPPDILLTNFMMLELLMTRQDEQDRRVIGNCAGLRFLVLDELHTYRGRQGADVALLVRRVRERLAPDRLQCIGTSATMSSEGSLEDRNRVVARVASRLFATSIPSSNVIVETLERVTDPDLTHETVRPLLGAAIDAGIAPHLSDAELRTHPLAVWIETRLGIRFSEVDQRWVRALPQTLDEAARALAADAGRSEDACREALRALLLQSSLSEQDRTGDPGASTRSFFAFKLHQFISGAGHAWATLERPGQRTVTVDGQQFLPGAPDKRLYPVHFCRECGHEYHPVRLVSEDGVRRFLARDIDDALPTREDDEPQADPDGEVPGFLTLHATDSGFEFSDEDGDYPEAWLDYDANGTPRLRPYYRNARAQAVLVEPSGKVGSGAQAWFIRGRFRFCLRCGHAHGTAARDRTRLASLSAEGRSSATTVLVGSVLRWMHGADAGLDEATRKLLGFTDNRQDAALQAGHFNDFLFVSLVRAGFLGALELAGDAGLGSEDIGAAQQRALGFDRRENRGEWLLEPGLMGLNFLKAEKALREVLTYRVWFDQRRGWRYTNPNLEDLGLLRVDYAALDELAANDALFDDAPDLLRLASAAERAAVYRVLFDHMRKWMAIRSRVLEPNVIDGMLQQSHSLLRTPWGFGADEKPQNARWLFVTAPPRNAITPQDEDLIVRGGSRSALGKLLRSSRTPDGRPLWSNPQAVRALGAANFDELVTALLNAAKALGFVSEESTPFDNAIGYRLSDQAIVFKRGEPSAVDRAGKANAFFRDFYANLAATLRTPMHPLFGFEAREHTAQVDMDKRAVREKRFRFGKKEREELAEKAGELRELGETSRFLPVMFCSPTMELGVDISALNAVYLRNVPPTPANYAQRSGRAGRSGQAALVLTYSSSQSPHDQYFFRDPRAMVHGHVRAPVLDLANRDLVESHLSAVWLACTEQPLSASIAELLVLEDPERPVRRDVIEPMAQPRVAVEAEKRIRRVLDLLADDLTPADAPWYPGRDAFADEIVRCARERFEGAFDRWRSLFKAAERQRDAARVLMDNYAATARERNTAQRQHAQAIDQLNLLQQRTAALSGDFYTYRYLATEGFLPGYNFPRLPLMAYIPATSDGRGKQTFLQRPRFLALSEFGPRSLVYHEGRAYRVVRAMLSIGQQGGAAHARLPTQTVRVCTACGAGHWTDELARCHSCRTPLGDAEIVNHTFHIENVGTVPAERITANDEERQRQGFELQTTFEWAVRGDEIDVRRGCATDAAGDVAVLTYGPGATITRLNKGLRRRKDHTQLGFRMDPLSGYWAKNDDEGGQTSDPETVEPQWIVPTVRDRKNALHFQLAAPVLSALATSSGRRAREAQQRTLATVQHALLRGIEAVFQLEEGEMLAEPLPSREERTGFLLYEATEGGAGVLTRLVAEPERLAEVAHAALDLLHFDLAQGLPEVSTLLADKPDTRCVAACYRCVMSYYNQPDHELLDRRDEDARTILLRLARAQLVRESARVPEAPPLAGGAGEWMAWALEHDLPPVDEKPLAIGANQVPLVWRKYYVAALLTPDAAIGRALEDQGFEIVIVGESEPAWADSATTLARHLGRTA